MAKNIRCGGIEMLRFCSFVTTLRDTIPDPDAALIRGLVELFHPIQFLASAKSFWIIVESIQPSLNPLRLQSLIYNQEPQKSIQTLWTMIRSVLVIL